MLNSQQSNSWLRDKIFESVPGARIFINSKCLSSLIPWNEKNHLGAWKVLLFSTSRHFAKRMHRYRGQEQPCSYSQLSKWGDQRKGRQLTISLLVINKYIIKGVWACVCVCMCVRTHAHAPVDWSEIKPMVMFPDPEWEFLFLNHIPLAASLTSFSVRFKASTLFTRIKELGELDGGRRTFFFTAAITSINTAKSQSAFPSKPPDLQPFITWL